MNPFELLKNTQALKEQSEKIQNELANITAEGSSGGRMVTVKVNGRFEMISIKLDPICVDNRDVQMLQDLIVAAHKSAMENVQEQIKSKTSSLLGGMDLSQFGLQKMNTFDELTNNFSRLPGIGKKSAVRIVNWLLNQDKMYVKKFA